MPRRLLRRTTHHLLTLTRCRERGKTLRAQDRTDRQIWRARIGTSRSPRDERSLRRGLHRERAPLSATWRTFLKGRTLHLREDAGATAPCPNALPPHDENHQDRKRSPTRPSR